MKRQMMMLQSAQSDAPGEGRIMAGASGYADFHDVNDVSTAPTDAPPTGEALASQTSSSSDDSPATEEPLLQASSPYADMTAEGNVGTHPADTKVDIEQSSPVRPAPYLVSFTCNSILQMTS